MAELVLILNTVVFSMFVGAIYGFLGYLKSRKPFNPRKLAFTVAVGAFVGLVAPYTGIELNETSVESYATATGMVVLLQTVLQAMLKREGGGARRRRSRRQRR